MGGRRVRLAGVAYLVIGVVIAATHGYRGMERSLQRSGRSGGDRALAACGLLRRQSAYVDRIDV